MECIQYQLEEYLIFFNYNKVSHFPIYFIYIFINSSLNSNIEGYLWEDLIWKVKTLFRNNKHKEIMNLLIAKLLLYMTNL